MRLASSWLFPWVVVLAFLIGASLLTGCGNAHERDTDAAILAPPDAPLFTDAAGCSGTGPSGCGVCGGDAFFPPTCVGSSWMCPIGTTPLELCPPSCWGPPPGPDCRCDLSGARPEWLCEPEAEPPCPAVRRLGVACEREGQLCGDSCCDTAAICAGGVWTEGPIADCAACNSFECGAGTCRADQTCASFGCPGDETCLPNPPSCERCDCLLLPPDVSCEERDGHLFLYGGDCA